MWCKAVDCGGLWWREISKRLAVDTERCSMQDAEAEEEKGDWMRAQQSSEMHNNGMNNTDKAEGARTCEACLSQATADSGQGWRP